MPHDLITIGPQKFPLLRSPPEQANEGVTNACFAFILGPIWGSNGRFRERKTANAPIVAYRQLRS